VSRDEARPLTGNIARGTTTDLSAYVASGGYRGFRRAVLELTPQDVTGIVKEAGLLGRGGAGFPTGVKWELVPLGANSPRRKYLVCNADEMEPGTFKDRLLMERDPHQLIEGMLIAAYAIQATNAYVFLRGEYVKAEQCLETAIAQARAAGFIGPAVFGSPWSIDVRVHTGAGRYICGEETALINSLEGRRAVPRSKPPFPQISGLWGKPTVVNNVETLANVPHIVANGADWYRALSTGKSSESGTKLYGVSGRVKRPGVHELPLGTTAREILEVCGGMQDGLALKCWLPGGASTDFLLPEHLDLPMDYRTIAAAGSRMGTGMITVIDDRQDLVAVLRNIEAFFARESCGWCTPCRDGLPWTVRLLAAIEAGEGKDGDIEQLERMVEFLGPGRTFCLHAPGAMEPLQSALRYFRAELTSRIASGRAPGVAAS
jgi:NADH-quinone oxidoreductase subunit F